MLIQAFLNEEQVPCSLASTTCMAARHQCNAVFWETSRWAVFCIFQLEKSSLSGYTPPYGSL